MYRYRNNSTVLRNIVSKVSEALVPLTLFSSFYVLKVLNTPVYSILITASIAIGALIVFRRVATPYLCLILFLLAVLTNSILMLFSLYLNWGFITDLLLVLVILFTYTYYRYVDGLEAIFVEYIPFTLVISTIVGIYLGVGNTLRYLLLTLIDSMASATVFSSKKSAMLCYTSSLFYFITLYTSPLTNLSLRTLMIFTLLHVVRNILTFSSVWSLRSRGVTGYVLGLDILLKPLVIAVWT